MFDYLCSGGRRASLPHRSCGLSPRLCGGSGYGESCWGLTAGDDPEGYLAHAPDLDNGTIAPTASGFFDAFCEQRNWFSDAYLAIDQGPIIVMIENYRTGLLWKLFVSIPQVQAGLRALGFSSPHLDRGAVP